MGTYKTPGVYIDEVSLLPASIAPVETAIPVFLGYTKKAKRQNGEDLLFKPVKIESMLEFESLYGTGTAVNLESIDVNPSSWEVNTVEVSTDFYLYECMRLFFANGGGECYVVSLGVYESTFAADKADFLLGLDTAAKVDEITLIVMPDLNLLTLGTEIGEVQQAALKQCARLQDRFSVFDIAELDGTGDLDADVSTFRDNVGMNNLKYGASYTPYLEVSLPKPVTFEIIDTELLSAGLDMKAAATSETVEDLIASLRTDLGDMDALDGLEEPGTPANTFYARLNAYSNFSGLTDFTDDWEAMYATLAGGSANTTNLKNALQYLYEGFAQFAEYTALTGSGAANVATLMLELLDPQLNALVDFDDGAVADAQISMTDPVYDEDGNADSVDYQTDLPAAGYTGFPGASPYSFTTTGVGNKIQEISDDLDGIFQAILRAFIELMSTYEAAISSGEGQLYSIFPVYKNIVEEVRSAPISLPPSAAVVGAYTYVDENRGVWKAPANLSLRSISGLSHTISHEDQENYNVDPTTGKSVNAIRFFKGKGNLIWGARTLAGNDNEWRYVPVRRLFIMVEESVKKATEPIVFEPNDAKTWNKVKGMISNFLTGLWRDGALAGAKPDEAYYVNVGLGETMTSQDVLEGRLIVEIGMAAVRPAEFIILRFMHKLQES